MIRQRWTTGAIVQVPLSDTEHAYAQMLAEPEYAFFDVLTERELEPHDVVQRGVLFRLWVMRHAHSKGRWRKIGSAPLGDALDKPVPRYNQDLLTGKLFTTIDGADKTPATREQCQLLERAAVWEPEHVEDRLRDHFAGRPNAWVESLRFK